MTFTTLLTAGHLIKAGSLVGVAVSSTKRHPAYPDIPTFTEQGFGDLRGDTWFWLAGPKNLPVAVTGALNNEMRRIMSSPIMRAHLDSMGLLTLDLDPEGVAKFIGEEYAYWAPLAKEAGLTVQ
jgi:tripartite-type tricarboxylate transporter receptor subunit TctC